MAWALSLSVRLCTQFIYFYLNLTWALYVQALCCPRIGFCFTSRRPYFYFYFFNVLLSAPRSLFCFQEPDVWQKPRSGHKQRTPLRRNTMEQEKMELLLYFTLQVSRRKSDTLLHQQFVAIYTKCNRWKRRKKLENENMQKTSDTNLIRKFSSSSLEIKNLDAKGKDNRKQHSKPSDHNCHHSQKIVLES